MLGYYPAWKTGVEPHHLRYDRFTHLAHAFASPSAEGAIEGVDLQQAKALTGPAHAAHVQVLLSLGGGGSGSGHFAAVMKDKTKKERFIAESVRFVEEAGYDGLDCDWEFPESDEEASLLVELVATYRKRLPNTLLTMAVNAGEWYAKWFDHKNLLPLFDFLNVMTYDFHGPWGDHAGHNSPLLATAGDPDGGRMNCAASMQWWHEVKGFPKEKLNLGIPCYGRSFAVAKWHEKPIGKSPREYVSYKTCLDLEAKGWTRHRDDSARVPYLAKSGEHELISFEDLPSAKEKGAWAKANGYRGIFFWEVTQDLLDGDHVLVQSARSGFLG